MIWILLSAATFYAFWCVFLFLSQERLMFPRHFVGPASPNLPDDPRIEQLWITPEDGVRVEAWLVLARAEEATPRPLVVFFHGNAELIEYDLDVAGMYRNWGAHVLLPEYRGYGRSTGSPTQRGITRDALAFVEMAAQRPDVDEHRIIFHGRSIGGGVACAVAAHREPAAMVLESTFASAAAMARRYLVPSVLLRHPFRNDRVLRGYSDPVLLLHGSRDTIISPSHSRRLHEIAPDSTLHMADAGHNDFPPDWRWYTSTIRAFLNEHGLLD